MSDEVKTPGESRELAVSPANGGLPMMPLDPMAGPMAFWAGWDTKTEEGAALVTRCLSESDLRPDKVIGTIVEVTRLFFHAVEINDVEGGEIIQAIRAVLILADEQTLSFTSEGALKSLRVLCQLRGAGPYNPPLSLRVRQLTTRAGRRTYALELVPKALPAAKGGKR